MLLNFFKLSYSDVSCDANHILNDQRQQKSRRAQLHTISKSYLIGLFFGEAVEKEQALKLMVFLTNKTSLMQELQHNRKSGEKVTRGSF